MTEIEQLRAELDEQCRLLGAGSEREARLMAQLAESQAREAKLRVELERIGDTACGEASHQFIALQALALPSDDSALKARLKAERERIATYMFEHAQMTIGERLYVATTIRNMGDE